MVERKVVVSSVVPISVGMTLVKVVDTPDVSNIVLVPTPFEAVVRVVDD